MTDNEKAPNIVFIFADEWRAQAAGFAGDPNCLTPVLDKLSKECINVTNAVSGHPVCCPYRASLMTGKYPLNNGVFINDVELDPNCYSIARAFNDAGYKTAYIGKWHLYGSPRGKCERRRLQVPRSHQMGFDDWWGFECCHDYWNSPYHYNDVTKTMIWEGYDLFDQAKHAAKYINDHKTSDQPYFLMLSLGPPHFPLHTAPHNYKALYKNKNLQLRPNVPEERRKKAMEDLRGYYAHISAMDEGLKQILDAIENSGEKDNTILVITSDHGEMAQSHGFDTKFVPFEESLRVPMLIRWPDGLGINAQECPALIDAPDIMPTLLGLINQSSPAGIDGRDWSPELRGEIPVADNDSAYMQYPVCYTEMLYYGMHPYRGIRTMRYTYTETRSGPWLLFDNEEDPYQMKNLVNDPDSFPLLEQMQKLLKARAKILGDEFLDAQSYLDHAGLSHYEEVNWQCSEKWYYRWHS